MGTAQTRYRRCKLITSGQCCTRLEGRKVIMSDPLIRGLSSRQNTTIDQLCYTWSTIGYSSSLAAGFRIRAASPGLQGANDDRVKSLDRYLRYSLPEGADRFE